MQVYHTIVYVKEESWVGQFVQRCVRWLFIIHTKKCLVIYNDEKSDDFLSTATFTWTILINIKIKDGRNKWAGFLELSHEFGSMIRQNDVNDRILVVSWLSCISGMRYALSNNNWQQEVRVEKTWKICKNMSLVRFTASLLPHIFIEGY
jgi:hypothetical protein